MSAFETLELCFTANLSGVDSQLNSLISRLDGLSASVGNSERVLADVGRGMARGLKDGYAEGLPAVAEKIAASGAQMRGWLTQAVTAAGPDAQGERFARMFAQGAQGQVSAAKSAGAALTSGFASGIRSGKGAVGSAVSAIVSSATAKIRSMLSIHSPSKVTEGFGRFFGEGFAKGVTGSAQEVAKAAEGLSDAATGGLRLSAMPAMESARGIEQSVQQAVERALGDVQLTIPLNVDGMKLGEASIRGINAVTRSAGRLLLNI